MSGKGKYCRTCWKITSANRDKDNPNWSGDLVGFHGVHTWVRRRKIKPKLCSRCKKKKKKLDLANISGKYLRDVNDYKWICRKCHMSEDGRLEKFMKMARHIDVFS